MSAKKTLELNPSHPVIKKLLNELKESDGEMSDVSKEYATLLWNMAILNSGFSVTDPVDLTEPLEKLIKVGFGLERDAPSEEIEVELDDEEEEEEEEVEGDFDFDLDSEIDLDSLNEPEPEQPEE